MSPPAAAKSLTTAATLFPGPGRATNTTPSANDGASFRFVVDGTVQTLSSQNTPGNAPIRGLMFVPSLDVEDSCNNLTAPLIPAHVTRHPDVDRFRFQTIGLAPWVNAECAESFIDASQRVGSDALVFFLPGSNNTKPPPAEHPTWSLKGGGDWKSRNILPVYAIPGPAGATLMNQLAWYSGNTSHAHNGHPASASVTGRPDVRLLSLIDFERAQGKMPSLWGFILAILGTILVLSMIVLLCYQLVQKRRRERLQRRIESGEADMEMLGLHLMKVPQEILDTLPIYTYPDWSALGDTPESNDKCSVQSKEVPECTEEKEKTDTNPDAITADEVRDDKKDSQEKEEPGDEQLSGDADNSPSTPSASQSQSSINTCPKGRPPKLKRLSHSQTTCAICLEDFVPHKSTVRELTCNHIFHVECIDASLTRNSCLCPMCKKSVLPPGYYPVPITNRVVHRDFMMRRANSD
ncbi:RING finger domain protein [Aspergillus bombycis]|uniref:RING finger domain protein n=1 Tax=Aspergillus bombycis TaxID=109264 RepID=A0A1F8ABI1_9EURO|nr:RING finger domain protein [Aspergillus bombycis]OGM49086.1 RING finger domain protein [Aspergillus bombycis]